MSVILRLGSRGPAVTRLQSLLNLLVKLKRPLVADGIFGRKTYQAVLQFQHEKQLVGDGIVGAKTAATLEQLAALKRVGRSPVMLPLPDPKKPLPPIDDYADIKTSGSVPTANGEVNTYDVTPYGIFFLPKAYPVLTGKLKCC